jgi:hypothetical protein
MKPWYYSKTIFVNLIIILLAFVFDRVDFYINPLYVICLIAVLNIVVRCGTRRGLTW